MSEPRPMPIFLVLVILGGLLLGPGAALAQDIQLQRDRQPKTFVTDFSWYQPNMRDDGRINPSSLACTRAAPRRAQGEITATDYLSSGGYYGRKYQRFANAGVDGIAFVVTGDVPGSFSGDNMIAQAGYAVDAGLEIVAYYDTLVTTANGSGLLLCPPGAFCNAGPNRRRIHSFDLDRYPEMAEQMRRDFRGIAENLILPNMNATGGRYSMLEDAEGNRVLDEQGLPRPILTLYLVREFNPRVRNQRAIAAWLEEVTGDFRAMGIGRPALVLDMLFWGNRSNDDRELSFDPDIIEGFRDYAVALTWYGFFDDFRAQGFGISNSGGSPMRGWARELNRHFRKVVRKEIEGGDIPLMIWPGTSTQIDTRPKEAEGCRERGVEVVYHARNQGDWRAMRSSKAAAVSAASRSPLARMTMAWLYWSAGTVPCPFSVVTRTPAPRS